MFYSTSMTNASADAGIVRQDSPKASQPQAILKIHSPSSLDIEDLEIVVHNK